MAILVAAFAVEHPELTTVDAFLDALEATPTQSLLTTMLCDLVRDPEIGDLVDGGVDRRRGGPRRPARGHPRAQGRPPDAARGARGGARACSRDPPDVGGQRSPTIEPRIRGLPGARPRAARRRPRAYAGSELIERDDRRHPLAARRSASAGSSSRPTYFSRPYNILLAGTGLAVLRLPRRRRRPGGRPTGSLRPPAVVRLHRALGDETRLRILKLLAGRDLYLTEIAQQLELSKPTIKHHLALLRAAGLVTVVEAGSVIYYSLRRDRIDDGLRRPQPLPHPLIHGRRHRRRPRRSPTG